MIADGTRGRGHDPESPLVHRRPCEAGSARPTSSTAGRPRPAARDLHPRRNRNHGDSRRGAVRGEHDGLAERPDHDHLPGPAGDLRPGRGQLGSGTTRAGSTSTSCPGWPSPRSATPTRRWPTPSASRPAPCCTCRNLFGTDARSARWPPPSTGCWAAGRRVFFCNSGAEANECAIKLARKWGGRGRYVVVSAYGSFHGRTLATLHATGQPAKHEAFQPLPEGFRHVAWQDLDALADGHRPHRGGGAPRAGPGRGRGATRPARSTSGRSASSATSGESC